MKATLQVENITHEDIVNLFSMSYVYNDFHPSYNRRLYQAVPKEKRIGNCLEDKIADCLLNGAEICITDVQAEGVVHNKKIQHKSHRDESVDYFITLDDIKKGFSCEGAIPYVLDLMKGEDDYWTFYYLMQYILFGEEIYG